MNSNVMSTEDKLVTQTNNIYGSNRLDYTLFVMGMAANETNYENSNLQEMKHEQVNYDVTQKFPTDQFIQALKPTQTDLAQVHGSPSRFLYIQFPYGVEFILSKMSGVNATNIGAGIIKNMLKAYDYKSWYGDGNSSVEDNPNGVNTNDSWSSDWESLKASFDAAMSRLRSATDITSENYSSVQFGYSENINNILSNVDDYNVSNREKLQKAYPSIIFREIPTNLVPTVTGQATFTLVYRPMLNFHHGGMPSVNGQELGKYGKSTDTLYACESSALEVETKGALQLVNLAPAQSQSQSKSASNSDNTKQSATKTVTKK